MIYKPEGDLVVNIIIKIKEDLFSIIDSLTEENNTIIIDLSNVNKIDISFIQILYSLSKYASQKNFYVKIQNPSDEVLSSLLYGGF